MARMSEAVKGRGRGIASASVHDDGETATNGLVADKTRYYRVAVTDGWMIDDEGRYLRDCIAYDCGHNHRSESTAYSCRDRLLNWDRDARTCSARWYNSTVLPVGRDGNHVPTPLDLRY
jgi:hypothetical protein